MEETAPANQHAAASKKRKKAAEDTNEDPFPDILRCKRKRTEEQQELWWHSKRPHLPLATEQAMISTLVHWKKTERGMLKDQPRFRKQSVQNLCHKHQVPLSLACSLRRHHMQRLNPYAGTEKLKLGREEDVRQSASIFEDCVEQFLQRQNVPFWGEEELKQHFDKVRQDKAPHPPTPDFLLHEEVLLNIFLRRRDGQKRIVVTKSICWVEAKMFYGASTIPHDNKSAVGCLLNTARKYTRTYGPGAMVFMHGCGERLAAELAEIGVLALDCSSPETVELGPVYAHQKTWCATPDGKIMP